MVNNDGDTALIYACNFGDHECAQALIDAGADINLTNQKALILACTPVSEYPAVPFPDESRQERERRLEVWQGKGKCALVLLEAMAPIQEVDFHDWAASLQFACERQPALVAAMIETAVLESEPALSKAKVLKAGVQAVVVDFARDMVAQFDELTNGDPWEHEHPPDFRKHFSGVRRGAYERARARWYARYHVGPFLPRFVFELPPYAPSDATHRRMQIRARDAPWVKAVQTFYEESIRDRLCIRQRARNLIRSSHDS